MPSVLVPLADRVSRSPYGERGLKFVRNTDMPALDMSLSLRRAWIEILLKLRVRALTKVALLTESVD